MSFYGYNPGNFIPDNSVWAKIGGIAAETLMKLPETMEVEKAYEEGRVNNDEIFSALRGQLEEADDDDILTYFGESKDAIVNRLKPGRKEGVEYQVRAAKIMSPFVGVKAKQNLSTAQNRISAYGKGMDAEGVAGEALVGQTFKGKGFDVPGDLKAIGEGSVPAGESTPYSPMKNYATKDQITQTARKYNVPMEQLQPEMDQATNIQDAKQLRNLDVTGTQASQMKAIGQDAQGIGANTMKAIGTLPNELQEANTMIAASGAQTDRIKAQAGAEGEVNKGNENTQKRLETFLSETEKAMNNSQSRYNQLQTTLGTTYNDEEKDDILKEMKKINKKIEGYQGDVEDTRKKLREELRMPERVEEQNTGGLSPEVQKDVSEIVNYAKATTGGYEQGIMEYAARIEQETGVKLGLTIGRLSQILNSDKQPSVSEIIMAIRQQAGL